MKSVCNSYGTNMTWLTNIYRHDGDSFSLCRYVQLLQFAWFQVLEGTIDVCCKKQKSLGRKNINMYHWKDIKTQFHSKYN